METETRPIREGLAAWIESTADRISTAEPTMPDGVTDRSAEIWEPLLAIADEAGDHWPETARTACVHFVHHNGPRYTSTGVRLLADLRALFTRSGADRMPTAELIRELRDLDEAPWADQVLREPLALRTVRAALHAGRTLRAGFTTARDLGTEGAGYADVRDDTTTVVAFRIELPAAGVWALDARYANGHGAVSYGYRAAMRTVVVDGRTVGTLVLPQRGIGRWDDWGYGTPLLVPLEAGAHEITLEHRPENRNMDGHVNGALVDHLRFRHPLVRAASYRAATVPSTAGSAFRGRPTARSAAPR